MTVEAGPGRPELNANTAGIEYVPSTGYTSRPEARRLAVLSVEDRVAPTASWSQFRYPDLFAAHVIPVPRRLTGPDQKAHFDEIYRRSAFAGAVGA